MYVKIYVYIHFRQKYVCIPYFNQKNICTMFRSSSTVYKIFTYTYIKHSHIPHNVRKDVCICSLSSKVRMHTILSSKEYFNQKNICTMFRSSSTVYKVFTYMYIKHSHIPHKVRKDVYIYTLSSKSTYDYHTLIKSIFVSFFGDPALYIKHSHTWIYRIYKYTKRYTYMYTFVKSTRVPHTLLKSIFV